VVESWYMDACAMCLCVSYVCMIQVYTSMHDTWIHQNARGFRLSPYCAFNMEDEEAGVACTVIFKYMSHRFWTRTASPLSLSLSLSLSLACCLS
jgi:hypothetical protein